MNFLSLLLKIFVVLLAFSVVSHASEYGDIPNKSMTAETLDIPHKHFEGMSNNSTHEHGVDTHCAVQFLPPLNMKFAGIIPDAEVFLLPLQPLTIEKSFSFDPPPPRT